MVTTFYPPHHYGGDAIFVYQLSNELAGRGHEVDIIYCPEAFRSQSESSEIPYPNHERVKLHTIDSRFGRLSSLLTHQTGRMMLRKKQISELFAKGNYDVINYHNVSLVGGLEILSLGDAVKLYTAHEYWLVCPTHVLFRNNKKACNRKKCLSCQIVHRRPPQFWRSERFTRQTMSEIDCLLVGNQFALDLHHERGLKTNARVLPLFTKEPRENSHPPEVKSLQKGDFFLFVGRLEYMKGLQDVLPIFVENPDMTLYVAGSGTYEKQLKQVANNSKNVRFLGEVSFESLSRLYRGAIATIIPSLCYETGPLVLAESWSCGTPVIVRQIGSLKEWLDSSGGGLGFNSKVECERALFSLSRNSDLRNRLGQEGKAVWDRVFTVETYLDRYFSIIEEFRGSGQGR